MLFNSTAFLVFFPLVLLGYHALPGRYRVLLLLGASYLFYMWWNVSYIALILASTIIDYLVGIGMENAGGRTRTRRLLLGASLLSNLGILFTFKYFNFFSESMTALLGGLGVAVSQPTLDVLLPVGISFYTFQTLSYTIEVFRGNQNAERNFFIFALYVSFFPQLVAGPIERSTNLLPQFRVRHPFNADRVTDGLKLMMWGFFKKVVIADNLAILVNTVYNDVGSFTGLALILATVFFAFQIYCDFSGYSDIAIGAAKTMGFDLMENFRRPYHANSIGDFWHRWHISLSTWFRDYLYIPLGGSRVALPRMYANLMITFIISGLWHGASWTFVIWGALNGFYLVFGMATRRIRGRIARLVRLDAAPRLHHGLQVLVTFILTNIAWVFFRANSLQDAVYVLTNMFTFTGQKTAEVISSMGMGNYQFNAVLSALVIMEVVHALQTRPQMRQFFDDKPLPVRWGAYYLVLYMILVYGHSGAQQFIYFQF